MCNYNYFIYIVHCSSSLASAPTFALLLLHNREGRAPVRLDRFLWLELESRQADQLAGKVFVVNEPLWSWTKVESILLNAKTVPLTTESVQQTSTHSEATSVEMVVTTLYLFIVLKISPEHNLHQKMPLETVCSKATYTSAGVAGLTGVTYIRIAVDDVTFITYYAYTKT